MTVDKGCRRDFAAMEARRMRAVALFRTGTQSQAAIARELGVSRQSVSRWYRTWGGVGVGGLRRAGRPGPKPRLSKTDILQLHATLPQGPPFCGYWFADRWTLALIAAFIKRRFGIAYHPRHIPYILRVYRVNLPSPLSPRSVVPQAQRSPR
jgi:transposase